MAPHTGNPPHAPRPFTPADRAAIALFITLCPWASAELLTSEDGWEYVALRIGAADYHIGRQGRRVGIVCMETAAVMAESHSVADALRLFASRLTGMERSAREGAP